MGRYVLIPLRDTALSVGAVGHGLEADQLSDGERDALVRAFERTVWMCELLVTYALGVGGKPSKQ